MRDASHIEEVLNIIRVAWYNNPQMSFGDLVYAIKVQNEFAEDDNLELYDYEDKDIMEKTTSFMNEYNKGPMQGASLTNMRITTK